MTLTVLNQYAPTAKGLAGSQYIAVTSLTSNGTTATATVASTSTMSTGDTVVIAGASISGQNGTKVITVASGTTFTYPDTHSGTSSSPGMPLLQDLSTGGSTFVASSIVGNGSLVTVTATAAQIALLNTGDLMSITTSTYYNGKYVITVNSLTTFVFPSTIAQTDAGTITALDNTNLANANTGAGAVAGIVSEGVGNVVPCGPRLSGDTTNNSLGWGIDPLCTQVAGTVSWNIDYSMSGLSTAVNRLTGAACFYYLSGVQLPNSGTAITDLIDYYYVTSANAAIVRIALDPITTGHFVYAVYPSPSTYIDTGIAIPYGVHFELRSSQQNKGSDVWNFQIAYRVVGTSIWIPLVNIQNSNIGIGSALQSVSIGFGFSTSPSGSYPIFYGRVSMPMLLEYSQWDTIFTVSGITITPTAGATYTNNGVTYTVQSASISGGSGTVSVTGVNAPTSSGTLTNTGGTGDATITFSSVVVGDPIAQLSTLATPVIDPTMTGAGYTWYFDPANQTGAASDSNVGTDSSHPFLTKEYMTHLARTNGVFQTANGLGWQNAVNGIASGTVASISGSEYSLRQAYQAGSILPFGDTIIVNNNGGAEIKFPSAGQWIIPSGALVKSSGGIYNPVNLSWFNTIATTAWSKTSGLTNTYQCAAPPAYDPALFQNRVTLANPWNGSSGSGLPITSITLNGTTATVVVASTSTLTTGNYVSIFGASVTGANGLFEITVSNSTTFTYPCTATGTVTLANVPFGNVPCVMDITTLIDNVAGSFYYNPTTQEFYLHPIGSTNPATDGNCYEATLLGVGDFAGIESISTYTGGDFCVQGISITGTTACNSNFGYQFTSSYANVQPYYAVWDTCHANRWSKHGFSLVAGGAVNNMRISYLNCISEGGAAWGTFGNGTAYVDYIGGTGSGNEAGYQNCNLGSGISQVVGSSYFGLGTGANGTYASHGLGTISGRFDYSDFSLGNGALVSTAGSVYNFCKLNYLAIDNYGGSVSGVANQCLFLNIATQASFSGTFNNCIFELNSQVDYGSAGAGYLNSCTLDYRLLGSTALINANGQVFILNLNECLLLPGSGELITQINTGTFASNYCEIQSPSSQNYIHNGSSNLTLAQAQADGFDVGSVTVTTSSAQPPLYQRTAQSSITHNTGPQVDFTGVLFSPRQTTGAYEYISPSGASPTGGSAGQSILWVFK